MKSKPNPRSNVKSLINTWITVETEVNKKTLGVAIKQLNDTLGTTYYPSRIIEMGALNRNESNRGARLDREMRIYMFRIVFANVINGYLTDINISKNTINKLSELLN